MNLTSKLVTAAAVLALSASPAFATGQPSSTPTKDDNPGTTQKPATTPTPNQNATDNPGSAKRLAAPGYYCRAESKKKSAGQSRSDFSTCVLAQVKLRSGKTDSPREACKTADRHHVKGERGTAFSRCVVQGAKALRDMKSQDEQASSTD